MRFRRSITDFRLRSDVQRLLDRVSVAANHLDHALRLLQQTRSDADFRRCFEQYTSAGTQFEFHDLAFRALLDAVWSAN
jgi:hypothetical protein